MIFYVLLGGAIFFHVSGSVVGYIPSEPNIAGLLLYSLSHASILHLAGNFYFFYAFKDVINTWGNLNTLWIFFLLGGLAGLGHGLLTQHPDSMLIGASGAIAGVITAETVYRPHTQRLFLIPFPLLPVVVLPTWIFLLVFVGLDFLRVAIAENGVGYWAHICGAFSGGAIALIDLYFFGGEDENP